MSAPPEEGLQGRWTMRQRDLGVAIWVAFLSACAGTFVMFGLIDPMELQSPFMERYQVSRKLAYGLGFGFLFGITFLSAWLAIFMVRSGPRRGHASGQGARPVPEIRDPAENNPDLDIEDIR